MTPATLRATLARLDLTQVEAARLLGVDARTMRKWIAGNREMPASAAIILTLMDRGKITKRDVERAIAAPIDVTPVDAGAG